MTKPGSNGTACLLQVSDLVNECDWLTGNAGPSEDQRHVHASLMERVKAGLYWMVDKATRIVHPYVRIAWPGR